MSDNIVILGGNVFNRGVLDNFKKMGFNTIVVDFRGHIDIDCHRHIVSDAKDVSVAKVLRGENIKNIKAVYTSMDNAGLAQRAICEEYGLKYASEDAITNAFHKNRMHKCWADAGLLNRESFALTYFNLKKIQSLNKKNKIIVKPANACASRGISILDENSTQETLKNSFDVAMGQSTNGFVNIEEFVEGTEFTVEMAGDNYGNISVFAVSKKYHTKNILNNKVAVKLHYNAKDVDEKLYTRIAEYGMDCYRALGLKNTLGHLEVLLKADGIISPVEIGARSSGYIASHFTDISASQSFLGTFIKIQNGERIHNGLIPQSNNSSMYFFYDIAEGSKVRNQVSLMDFINKDIKSLYSDRSKLVKGYQFKKLTQDSDRYGYEILVGGKDILTIEEVLRAEKLFSEALVK